MTERTAKCALITGASQGLGRTLAEECAGRGMDLVLVALPGTGLPAVASILGRDYGVRIDHVEMDLTGADAPERLCARMREKEFAVDMLVNNAGVGFTGRFCESTFRQNETTIQLNVAALVRLTHFLLPGLRLQRNAWVLNVASLGAFFPMPSMPVYSSTKSFVLSFSLVLREELRASSVSVSVVCPNGIRTNRRCRALIERQGWAGRVTCQYPDEVARAAINGLFRGKAIIVPGAVNKVLLHAGAFVPRTLYMRVISQRWEMDTARGAKRRAPAAGLSAAAVEA